MSYNSVTDFVGLWRAVAGGVEKGEMPGLDFWVAAMARAGLINVVVSGVPPSANQDTTAWFQTATPSYAAEGALYLWNGTTYVPATPALFGVFLSVSAGGSGIGWHVGTAGPPSNGLGADGDLYIMTVAPGGIYGPKAAGAWPADPLPGTSYSQISTFLDGLGATRGDVLFRGASAWQALAPGTAGFVLTTEGAGANPVWALSTVSSAALDAAFGSARGDFLFRGATNWGIIAAGGVGQFLATGGVFGDPGWATPLTSAAVDAAFGNVRGDMLFRGAGGWGVIAPGAIGQYLASGGASGDPFWTALSGSGAIGTTALSINGASGNDSTGAAYPGGWAIASRLTALQTGLAVDITLMIRTS